MSRELRQAYPGELARQDYGEPETAPAAYAKENAGATFVEDGDPNIAKAKNLLEQLEQTAKGHGYRSFSEMQRRLLEDREELNSESRYRLLKQIAPTLHEADGYTTKAPLPPADATGLLAIQDIVKSVSRLVRVLLVGYTHDELEELADRMKAERAVEVDSAMAQCSAETNHQAALSRVAATARASTLAANLAR